MTMGRANNELNEKQFLLENNSTVDRRKTLSAKPKKNSVSIGAKTKKPKSLKYFANKWQAELATYKKKHDFNLTTAQGVNLNYKKLKLHECMDKSEILLADQMLKCRR